MAATVAGRVHKSGAASSAARLFKTSSRSTTLPISILMATFVVVMLGTASCWAQTPPPPPPAVGLATVINLSPFTLRLVASVGPLQVTVAAGANVTLPAGVYTIVNVQTGISAGPLILAPGSVVNLLPGLLNSVFALVGQILNGVFTILQSIRLF